MIIGTTADARASTILDDEPIASGTYIASTHMESVPHAHIVTLPTYSPSTDGLILLVSRQLRWAGILPTDSIPNWLPDNLRKPLLNQIPIITRVNTDRLVLANNTYTIHRREFHGLSARIALGLFRASAITLYRYMLTVEHKK